MRSSQIQLNEELMMPPELDGMEHLNMERPSGTGTRLKAIAGQASTRTTHLSTMPHGKTGRGGIKEAKANKSQYTFLMEDSLCLLLLLCCLVGLDSLYG